MIARIYRDLPSHTYEVGDIWYLLDVDCICRRTEDARWEILVLHPHPNELYDVYTSYRTDTFTAQIVINVSGMFMSRSSERVIEDEDSGLGDIWLRTLSKHLQREHLG
jgi:hypothetical protein